MKIRRIVPLAAIGVLAAGAFLPAAAAPAKKPITKSYDMELLPGADLCYDAQGEGRFAHSETFKATGPGKLVVKITGFQADWDIALFDSANARLADGGGSSTGKVTPNPTENLIYKIKKAGTYKITSCNYAGSLEAKGSFVFSPGK